MSNYVTLLGAEQVQSAASSIQSSASEMVSAASSIQDTMDRHQRFMEDWLNRLDLILQDRIKDAGLS